MNLKKSKGMQFKEKNEEVLVATSSTVLLQSSLIDTLKAQAVKNGKRRIRLCTHKSIKDPLHEMFIVHTNQTYVRPHRHIGKVESLSILDGRAILFFFDESGTVTKQIKMGGYASSHVFYVRIDKPIYHTLLITSDYLVFHEVVQGPFDSNHAQHAPWSPQPSDSQKVNKYLDYLRELVKHDDSFKRPV